MSELHILRLRFSQPSAHYRVPFSFSRRHTYPIPPFSTVIGMLCNVLGLRSQEEEDFKKLKNLYMAIYGTYDSITREYVWFRNLSQDAHKKRFGSTNNRFFDGTPEHPGGQTPVRVDVLEDVKLVIYLGSHDEDFLKTIKDAFSSSEKWLYPLHLGRAEDLVIIDEIDFTFPEKPSVPTSTLPYFTWIPKIPKEEERLWSPPENYSKFFEKIFGTFHRVPTFYRIEGKTRIFDFVRAKLFEKGGLPLNSYARPFKFPEDRFKVEGREISLPLFLVKIGGENGK